MHNVCAGCPGPLPRPLTQTNNLLASMSSPAPQAMLSEAGLQPQASMPPTLYHHPPLLHAAMSSGTMSGSSESNPNIMDHQSSDAEVSGTSTSHSLSDHEGTSSSPQSVLRPRYDAEANVYSQPPPKISPKPPMAPLQQYHNAIAEHPEIGSPDHIIPVSPAHATHHMSPVQDHLIHALPGPATHYLPPVQDHAPIPSVQNMREQQMLESGPELATISPASKELLEELSTGKEGVGRYRLTRRANEPKVPATVPGANDLTGSNEGRAQQSQLLEAASSKRGQMAGQSQPGMQQSAKAKGKSDATSTFCFKSDVKVGPSKRAFLQCWGQ